MIKKTLLVLLMLIIGLTVEVQADTFVWNTDSDFQLPAMDTGNIQGECYIDAPWGSNSWGVEGSTFSDAEDYTLDWSRFASWGNYAYLYGKDESGKWGSVKYTQGDVWGGSHCGSIPGNIPEPVLTSDKDFTLSI